MSERARIAALLSEFADRRVRGEAVEPEDLFRSHPDIADELRERLAILDLLERSIGAGGPVTPPEVIDDYRLLRKIGSGGMGVVYEAEQVSMGRRVALKLLAPGGAASRQAICRFQREARAAGRLQHDNIVSVYALGHHRNLWYYAMEVVPGRSLATAIDARRGTGRLGTASFESQRLPTLSEIKAVAAAFAGVATALQVAHQAGIVHRDVKPSNLLIDPAGTLKLVDFGLAHLYGDNPSLTLSGEMLGTPAYMSPEQAKAHRGQVGYRSDIYSLGATLYEAVALRAPFEDDNLQDIYHHIAHSDPPAPRHLNPNVPRDLQAVILKAMEKQPRRRYRSAAEFAADLLRFAKGDPVQAHRALFVGRVWRRAMRSKSVSGLAAALVLVALIAGSFGWHAAVAWQAHRGLVYERLLVDGQALVAATPDGGGDRISAEGPAAIYTRAIELDPKRVDAYLFRALAPGRSLAARLADIDHAEGRGLDSYTAHLLRAYYHLLAGDPGSAATERDEAGRQPLGYQPIDLYLRARFADWDGAAKDALELLDEVVLRSRPSEAVGCLARRHRAAVQARLGAHEQAIIDLIVLQEHGDSRPKIRMQVASLRRAQGDQATAQLEFEGARAEVMEQSDPIAWLSLFEGCSCERDADWLDRLTAAAVERFPGNAPIASARDHALRHVEQGLPRRENGPSDCYGLR